MNDKILKQDRVKFTVDKKSLLIRGAVILTAASAILRLIGCWGYWDDAFFTTTEIILPICCNLLFIACLMLCGKKFFSLSSIPVILGAVFFIIRATDFVWWKMLISIIAYLATAFLYAATAFGIVRTKWPLVPVFGLPLIVHLVYDFGRLGDKADPVTLSAGLQEISILCIILSLLLVAFAMKKPRTEPEDAELPKIKGPKFIKVLKNKEESTAQSEKTPEAEVKEKPEEAAAEKSPETEAPGEKTEAEAGEKNNSGENNI